MSGEPSPLPSIDTGGAVAARRADKVTLVDQDAPLRWGRPVAGPWHHDPFAFGRDDPRTPNRGPAATMSLRGDAAGRFAATLPTMQGVDARRGRGRSDALARTGGPAVVHPRTRGTA